MGKMAQGVAARVVRLVLLASLVLVEARPLPGGEAAATLPGASYEGLRTWRAVRRLKRR